MKYFSDGTLLADAQDQIKDLRRHEQIHRTTFIQYEARGCIYDLEFYENGYLIVTMINSNDERKWSETTQAKDTDRVIDAVRSARNNAREAGRY